MDIKKEQWLRDLESLRGDPIKVLDFNDPRITTFTEVSDKAVLVKSPLVSVIVCTYNQEKFIRQCLQSIVSQKANFDFEVLVGDDCSSDTTLRICLDFQKQYPKVFRVIYPSSNGYNFIRLERQARGKYVAWCEGDDWWCDDGKLRKQVDVFRADPPVSICYTDFAYYINGQMSVPQCKNAGILNQVSSLTKKDYLTEAIFVRHGVFPATASIMVKKELLQERYSDCLCAKRMFLSDYPLRTYMAQHGKVGWVTDCCVVYRVNSGICQAMFTRGDIRLRVDCCYATSWRQWDFLSPEEIREKIDDNIKWLIDFDNADFGTRLRIAKLTFQYRVFLKNRLHTAMRLLFLLQILPRFFLSFYRHHLKGGLYV